MTDTKNTEQPNRRRSSVVAAVVVMISAFICCGFCRLLSIERFAVPVQVPDPPNSFTRARRYGGYLRGEFIWHKEYWIDANQYEDAKSILEYFDSWLLNNGWMDVPSFVASPTTTCVSLADVQQMGTENTASKTYVAERWSAPAPLELACVVITYDTPEHSYHVDLITVSPDLFREINE